MLQEVIDLALGFSLPPWEPLPIAPLRDRIRTLKASVPADPAGRGADGDDAAEPGGSGAN